MVPDTNRSRDRILERKLITLRGTVQGLGVRPAVARLARSYRLLGSVRNDVDGVRIDVIGVSPSISKFLDRLGQAIPTGFDVDVHPIDVPETLPDSFAIDVSRDAGPTRTIVPVDRKICADCLAETDDPSNRRYSYPFTSCTDCGPRYSILAAMPYDRCRTSMSKFEMCLRCRTEYEDPDDRRFHSQTNCCPDCGPRWWSIEDRTLTVHDGVEAMQAAAQCLRQGGIVSLKGIGGYQLVCDATNEVTVSRLRDAKRRPRKPLAVMVRDLARAIELTLIGALEQAALQSPAGPIVIARARRDTSVSDLLCRTIHPGLRDIGVMLPTTPLHHWLCDRSEQPLVVTSCNLEGEPILYEADQAERRMRGIVDLHLHHDREIIRPIDDSVVRCMANRIVTIRAGRGLAPLTIGNSSTIHAIAAGGHQKVAVAISNGYQSILGPHIGDMDHAESRARYRQQADALCQLYGCRPQLAAHDLHPDYFSTLCFQDRSLPVQRDGCSTAAVQHHHAHVVSAMAEAGLLDRSNLEQSAVGSNVLAIAMDGTGMGTDGTVWGGEFLRASATEFDRVGSLRPFRLAGGEAAIRDPTRVAIAIVKETIGSDGMASDLSFGRSFPETRQLLNVLANSKLSPITTSAGRLFDGVAAIVLNEGSSSYEGELAMRLEAICDTSASEAYRFTITDQTPSELDWRPMIRQLLFDRKLGTLPGVMAMRFHRGLARAIVSFAERFPELPVVLCGGVFQNRVLVELIADMMPGDRELGRPGKIPPNDGGLAAGQLLSVQRADRSRSRGCV